MIKALLLVFEPVMTWDAIARAKRSATWVLFVYLTPLILTTLVVELAGLHLFGKAGAYVGRPLELGGRVKLSEKLLVTYGIAQLVASYFQVVVGARIVSGIAQTFHSRHTYSQCFAVTAYAYGPFFLLRLLDVFPDMFPWASFGIGVVLTIATLYHGVPRVLEPDPPDAFGLYVCSMLLLACLAAAIRFLTLLVLAGKIHV